MRDEELRAMLAERWAAALARYGESLPADPEGDETATSLAAELIEEGRWADAARAFEEVLRREGPASDAAPAALFSLGVCRMQLDDARGALEATALFLELSDEEHPSWRDGVQNAACAAERLGQHEAAVDLRSTALAGPGGSRERTLRSAFGVLGWWREALPVSIDMVRPSGGARRSQQAQRASPPAPAPPPGRAPAGRGPPGKRVK